MDDQYVKILFRFYSNVLDQWMVETMWATIIDAEKGWYKIDNIPFYASVASDDVVHAIYTKEEEQLTYQETIEYSGNSIIQVVIINQAYAANTIRDMCSAFGCKSEKVNKGYFVIEILAAQDYAPIRQQLMKLEADDIIGYAEPVLSSWHQY